MAGEVRPDKSPDWQGLQGTDAGNAEVRHADPQQTPPRVEETGAVSEPELTTVADSKKQRRTTGAGTGPRTVEIESSAPKTTLTPNQEVDRAVSVLETALKGGGAQDPATAVRNVNRALERMARESGDNNVETLDAMERVVKLLRKHDVLKSPAGREALAVVGQSLRYADPTVRARIGTGMQTRGVRERVRREAEQVRRPARDLIDDFVKSRDGDVATKLAAIEMSTLSESGRQKTRVRGGIEHPYFEVPDKHFQVILDAAARGPAAVRADALRMLGSVRSDKVRINAERTGPANPGRDALVAALASARDLQRTRPVDATLIRQAAFDAMATRQAGAHPFTATELEQLSYDDRQLLTAVRVANQPFADWPAEDLRQARFADTSELTQNLGRPRAAQVLAGLVRTGDPELVSSSLRHARELFAEDSTELGRFTDSVHRDLVAQLRGSDPSRAVDAARALRDMGESRSIAVLLQASHDASLPAQVREAARPTPEEFSLFRYHARGGDQDILRRATDNHFATSDLLRPKIAEVQPDLLVLAGDPAVGNDALTWLARLGPLPSDAPETVITAGLAHPDATVRTWAAMQIANPASRTDLFNVGAGLAEWNDVTGASTSPPPHAESHLEAFGRHPESKALAVANATNALARASTPEERVAMLAVLAELDGPEADRAIADEIQNGSRSQRERLAALAFGLDSLPATDVVNFAAGFVGELDAEHASSLTWAVSKAIERADATDRAAAIAAIDDAAANGTLPQAVAAGWKRDTGLDAAHAPELVTLFASESPDGALLLQNLTRVEPRAFNSQVLPNAPDIAARLRAVTPAGTRLTMARCVLGHVSQSSSPEAVALGRELMREYHDGLVSFAQNPSARGAPETRAALGRVLRSQLEDASLPLADRAAAARDLEQFGIRKGVVADPERRRNIDALGKFYNTAVDTPEGQRVYEEMTARFTELARNPLTAPPAAEDLATVLTATRVHEGMILATRFRTEKVTHLRELAVEYMNQNGERFAGNLERLAQLAPLRDAIADGRLELEQTPDGKPRFDADLRRVSHATTRYTDELNELSGAALDYLLDPEVSESLGSLDPDSAVLLAEGFTSLIENADQNTENVRTLVDGHSYHGRGQLHRWNSVLHEESTAIQQGRGPRNAFARAFLTGDREEVVGHDESAHSSHGAHDTGHALHYGLAAPQSGFRAAVKTIHGIEAAQASMRAIGTEIQGLSRLREALGATDDLGALAVTAARARVLMRALRAPFVRSDALKAIAEGAHHSASASQFTKVLHAIEGPAEILRGLAGAGEVVWLASHPEALKDPSNVVHGLKGAAEAGHVGLEFLAKYKIAHGANPATLSTALKWTGRAAAGLGVAAGLWDAGVAATEGKGDLVVSNIAEAAGYGLLLAPVPGARVAGAVLIVGSTVYEVFLAPNEAERAASDLGYNVDINFIAEMWIK